MSRTKAGSLVICLLGLFAVTRLRAESITLTVDAGGTPIYFVTGTATQVSANTTVLNSTLAAFGFGFYQFSSLSGASNFPGTAQSANLILSGTITGVPGGSGAGLP